MHVMVVEVVGVRRVYKIYLGLCLGMRYSTHRVASVRIIFISHGFAATTN